MARRGSEPDEALGPAINGLDLLANSLPLLEPSEPPEEVTEPEPREPADEPAIMDPVLLLCGSDARAEAVGALANACGFAVELANSAEEPENDFSFARKKHVVPDFENIVENCGIDRNYFVGIFGQDEETGVKILSQCLASDAYYLGLDTDHEEKKRIFAELRSGGAPDAELAAIHCPIGLNLGAEGLDQFAVATVAEMLAAKNGTLNRLRHED